MSTIQPIDEPNFDLALAPQPAPMSEHEFESWALATRAAAEWVAGIVITMSPAARIHVELCQWLATLLNIYLEERNLGQLLGPEFMVRLAAQQARRVPDLLFVANANRARLQSTYLDGPPDLAVEIVSSDSQARDWREKYLEYEAAGVQEYWIIDPLSKTVEVSRLENGRYARVSLCDGKLVSQIVPGFYLRPEWLWSDPRPKLLVVLAELGIRQA
jgi:Uma2 family endonuclease